MERAHHDVMSTLSFASGDEEQVQERRAAETHVPAPQIQQISPDVPRVDGLGQTSGQFWPITPEVAQSRGGPQQEAVLLLFLFPAHAKILLLTRTFSSSSTRLS